MQSARIDEIDRKGRTDTDDADGMTAGEPMSPNSHGKSVDAQPPWLSVCRCDTARATLSRDEFRFESMRMPSGFRKHPVHARAGNARNQNSVDALCGPKHRPREIARPPPSKGLGTLAAEASPIEPRPLHPSVTNVYEQSFSASLRPHAHAVALTDTSPEINLLKP